MEVLFSVLFGLFVVLTIITVVGHGIWVLLDRIYHAMLGISRPIVREVPCPFCSRRTSPDRDRCHWCGREIDNALAREVGDLAAFRRQLFRFQSQGVLTMAEAEALRAQAEAYRQKLMGLTVETTPEPAAKTPPAAPAEVPVELVVPEVIAETEEPAAAVEDSEEPVEELPAVDPSAPIETRPPSPAPPPTIIPEPAQPPRKSWLETLAGIMEEREIPWAEPIGLLVGGLLILGSSIALVISLWETLERVPVFKFAVFMAVISMAFGMGLYIYHRWKLESTGRFVLMLATLLVPLGFLAMASLSKEDWTPLILAAELGSLGLSTWLVNMAARVVVPRWRWLNVLAVIGNSAAVLLIARLSGMGLERLSLTGVGLLPVGVFATVVGVSLWRAFDKERDDSQASDETPPILKRAISLLTLQGTAIFATAVSLGLLMAKGAEVHSVAMTLDYMAVLFAILALPVLASGLTVMRETAEETALGLLHTVGTILAIAGILGLLVALGMAWPQPAMLVAVGLLSTAALVWVALRHSLPIAHAGAMAAATLVYLTGFHLLAGHLPALSAKNLGPEMLRLMVTGQSGLAMLGLVVLFGAVAELLARGQRREHAVQYAGGSGVVALLSLLVVTGHALHKPLDASLAAALYAVYGLGAMLVNVRYRKREVTYLGLGLLTVATGWGLWWQTIPFGQPWANALLGLATAAVVARVLLDGYLGQRSSPGAEELREAFVWPLNHGGLTLSVLAGLAMLYGPWPLEPLAINAFWLAAIWLVMAWIMRSTGLLTACQAMLTVATLLAISAWLARWVWPIDLTSVSVLQVYGIGLAAIGLLWGVARIATRPVAQARWLLGTARPTIDRVVLHAVVAAQLVLAVYHLMPAVGQELALGTAARPAVGPEAWVLVGLLALTMLVALWERWQKTELVSSLLLVGTVPWLVAEPFSAQLAAASAVRWGLAVAMGVGVTLVWQRERLDALARVVRARLELDGSHALGMAPPSDSIARTVVVTTTALPVLALTIAAAWLQLAGTSPAGPMRVSWFFEIGPSVSYLVPLLLVIAGFVALALRETSAGYAFSAGLVVEMSVVLGYALALVTRGIEFDVAEAVMAIQLATIAAGLWALVWLVARRWVRVWREEGQHDSARHLMNAQLGLGIAGNALLLVPALLLIVFIPRELAEWPAAVGQVPGWIALALVVAATAYRQLQTGKTIRPELAGRTGMAMLALLACSIAAVLSADWAYRTLMLGWASYAVFIVLATWWVASLRTLPGAHGPPQALIRAAATWVTTAAHLAVLLGLKLAVFHRQPEDLLWAAAGIAVPSVAGAMMAVWRRQEAWAFAATPGVNVAASLVVWYFHKELSFESWWTLLLEANVIATASVALLWLAARRRLYQLREMTIRTSPLLAFQTSLGVIGCVAMLALPLSQLMWDPSELPAWAAQLAAPPGWIAVLLAAAAAGWYLRQVSPGDLMHVVGGLGLALGVLATCVTAGPSTTWTSIHVLMACWASVGLLVLGIGYVGQNLRLAEQSDPLDSEREGKIQVIFPPMHVQFWVTAIAVLTVGLVVLHGLHHLADPWWPVGAVAAVSVTLGLMAMWMRLPEYVWFSGLLVNLAAIVIWLAYGPRHVPGFVETNVLGLAIGASLWSLAGRLHRDGIPGSIAEDSHAEPSKFAFPPLALALAMLLAGSMAVAFVVWDVFGYAHPAVDRLGWTTLAALALAALVLLWDRTVRIPLANLYGVGLVGVVMAVEAWAASPRMLGWLGAAELAGFALLAAIVARLLPLGKPMWQTLRISLENRGSTLDWFPQVQLLVAGLAAGLSAWVAIDPAFGTFGQFAGLKVFGPVIGPAAALCLVAASVLTANGGTGRWRAIWQQATLGLGVLLVASTGWAWLDPAISAPWLHRSVIAMVAAVVMLLVAGAGLARLVPEESDWLTQARGMLPGLAGVALAMMTAILVQEGLLRFQGQVDFMALPAVVAVAIALVAQVVMAIGFAVAPKWDPLHLSDRGRTAYVYAAEVLIGLVGLHVWLTKPHLFQLGILRNYWMLIVMGVAFGGAVLSELFHRRGFPVLSEPLERTAALLPLAPAIGFWLPIHPSTSALLAGNSPALWFLAGLFYGFLAVSRRSFGYGLLAAIATNLGLWVLWDRLSWEFLAHPQLWLIPWGLTILVAEYVNHKRLTSLQSAGLRYLGLLLIYVPSSTEFLREVGQSLWLPMILIGLSVLGVALGIALRIRSFLFLGITFLTLVLVTMIWYAAIEQQHMWIFWIFCIGLGVAVLALVAFYEKRRNDVLAAVRQLKQWER